MLRDFSNFPEELRTHVDQEKGWEWEGKEMPRRKAEQLDTLPVGEMSDRDMDHITTSEDRVHWLKNPQCKN